MINPSVNGWIDKFFLEQKSNFNLDFDADQFYINVRKTGFIFGYITSLNTKTPFDSSNWLKSEFSKVALLNTLFQLFCLTKKDNNSNDFILAANLFYNEMNPQGFDLLKKLTSKNNTTTANLEKTINDRIKTNETVIEKNFSHIATNALLFVDVLAFQQYLTLGKLPNNYTKKLEATIMNIVALALKTKINKSQHDDLLIKLFESSLRFDKFLDTNIQNIEVLNLTYFKNDLEKKYFIDLAGLTLWSDGVIEKNEAYFLYKLAEKIEISDDFVTESIAETNNFITKYKAEIPYFNYSNPVKIFYDHTTQYVMKLIVRNKKRLSKELMQSKELMVLLANSTNRELNESEKKKVKNQLLDICKTVPSLTIFLIPGGSLLLPLLIKFIPQLLPSSFNENLEENE